MKGSDKWGTGTGPRIRPDVLLVGLAVVALVGVYLLYEQGNGLSSGVQVGAISTVSTTGIGCNDPSMPPAPQAVEQNPIFANLTNGLCYNYVGESPSGEVTGGFTLGFAYYNGTISYPCGDAPQQQPQSEIQVVLSSAQQIVSAQVLGKGEIAFPTETCGTSIPLKVVSVTDVGSTIPAVPQLNVTLSVPGGGRPVGSLKAVLTLDGGSQTFRFGGVSSTNPLSPPRSASSIEIVLSNLTFNADEVYPMAVSGTFVGGQAFSYVVHVQIAGIP